jgi:DNA ligase-1
LGVSHLRIEFHDGGLHLAQLGLWIDPSEAQLGPEKVFISHAHSDHIGAHREVILSAPTARLMQARLPGSREEHILDFGQTRRFEGLATSFDLTLLPAGHIFGSAMARIEADFQSILYTGDFKLRPGLSAEPCEPRQADLLIMETTYGRPQYVFPPAHEVLKGVIRFCREALDNEETPVLLGYSLGKSQELLCGLGDAGLPLMLHGTIFKLTQIYEQFGRCFPKYEPYDAGTARGKVLLCPPHVVGSAMVRNLGKSRSAVLTGWAVDPNCRYRYQCDAAFALSDHADFPDLVEMVKRVQPKKVYTLHGFAADFAQTLRELGFDAQALSQDEQLPLPLIGRASVAKRQGNEGGSRAAVASPQFENASERPASDSFLAFATVCARIGADSRKLEKVRLLSEYFSQIQGTALALAATWFTGRPFAASQNKVLQLGWALLRDALRAAGGVDEVAFHQVYLKHSDLGETAAEVLAHRSVLPSLSLERVGEIFNVLNAARGRLAKAPLLSAALEQCTAIESKYFVKVITGDLRIGLKEGLVEEAIARAFSKPAEEVRQANLLLGDIGETAKLAAAGRLGETVLVPFRPVKFMLASPEETAADIWKRVHENQVHPSPAAVAEGAESNLAESIDRVMNQNPQNPIPAIWVEEKYDGIRCQLHKVGKKVALYSRDLKDITPTFFEVADTARNLPVDFVLDGEMIAMRGEEVLAFAELQKRLGRRQDDLFMREEVPIVFIAFDCLWRDGESFLDRPLKDRRSALESLAPLPASLRLAPVSRVDSIGQIEEAFQAARAHGNEGLVIKDPSSSYTAGRRGLAWLKLKKPLATLDCVVIGAEYGHGKRNKVLSDYTFALRDDESGELKTIGKAYTGLTDAEIESLTAHFLKHALRRHGRYFEVPPDTVLEIAFDRLQISNRHPSGLAMRFPRIVRIRTDKTVAEIDTLETARKLVSPQEKRKS